MYSEPTRSARTRSVSDGVRDYILAESQVATDGVAAITDVMDRLVLLSSTVGNKPIATTSAHEGQRVSIFLIDGTAGTYTLAVTGGALTFAASNDHAFVEYVNGAWKVIGMDGATIV